MRNATLILGGGGFIGRRLITALQRSGVPLSVLGHGVDDARSADFVQRRGSVEDTGLLRELLDECSSVVYLASVTTPSASAREPGLEVTGNLLPLTRFLEVAQNLEPRKLVFISSAGTVYGECAEGVSESAPLRPRSYYGAGKVAAEVMLHAFAVNSAWPTIILRPTNVYGPGQLPIKGFAIVPTIFRHMLEQRVFEIWGDGSVVRDYLFVDDLCELIARVLSRAAPAFSVYNVGAGSAVSILELVRHCEEAARTKIATTLLPARKVDVPRAVPDTAAVAAAYGWSAATPLNSGLEQTWQWLLTVASTANITRT
jgi:UDP-glucose 4-epimerase